MNKELYTFDKAMKFRTLKDRCKAKYNKLFKEGKYYMTNWIHRYRTISWLVYLNERDQSRDD
jgi:hypothetical protein